MRTTETAILPPLDFLEYRYTYDGETGPLSTATDGRPMRVDAVTITTALERDGSPYLRVDMTGHAVRADGARDRRAQWERRAFDEALEARIVAHFTATTPDWQARVLACRDSD